MRILYTGNYLTMFYFHPRKWANLRLGEFPYLISLETQLCLGEIKTG